MSIFRALLGGALLAGLSCGAAQASYIAYGNLTNGNGSYDIATSAGLGNGPLAQSFTSLGGSIHDITLALAANGNIAHPNGNGSVIITLNADSSNAPGSVLDTIATVSVSALTAGTMGTYSLSGLDIQIAPNTTYWIEVKDAYTGTLKAKKTTIVWDVAANTTGNASIGVVGQSVLVNGQVQSAAVAAPLVMQINTPEPATLGVLGAGIAGLGWARRRRARKAAKD